MCFNKDCARNILLYVRENCAFRETKYGTFWHEVSLDELCESERCSQYGIKCISYTINTLSDYELIKLGSSKTGSKIDKYFNNVHINSLTSKGHEFIDNLLSDEVWEQVKTAIKKAEIDDCSLNLYFEYIYNEIRKRLNS